MKIKFTKKGVFYTSEESDNDILERKSSMDQIIDLDDDQANVYLQKGWAVPAENLISVNEEDEDGLESEEAEG